MAAHLAPATVGTVLERALLHLDRDAWHVFDTRDARLADRRADLVVVGPPGLFVIVCGRPDERERARAKELMALLDTAQTVAGLAGIRRDEVHPVLCLSGPNPEDSWARGVAVCSVVNLADVLAFKRDRLNHAEVTSAARAVKLSIRVSGRHRAAR